jgi:two-component system response regulator AtoC
LAVEARALKREPAESTSESAPEPCIIVGDSLAMRDLLEAVARIGPKDTTLLVHGETGTGKELIASLVHDHKSRSSASLVRFNCAAIPGDLAEAGLFGRARGAFTGAAQERRGFFALADGRRGRIEPVDAGRVERIDVRVAACANCDLEVEVRPGRFREDPYYQLAAIELLVPPLRDRREDIPALAAELTRRYGERFGNERGRLSPALVDALCHLHFAADGDLVDHPSPALPDRTLLLCWPPAASP